MTKAKEKRLSAEGKKLLGYITRIEAVLGEKKELGADVSEIKKEATEAGFNLKTINSLIKLRDMSQEERDTTLGLLDQYATMIGMQLSFDLPEPAPAKDPALDSGLPVGATAH